MNHQKKGFTLIELLIVIGILAILATTVVLVLNPAQILAESRDTQRISDMDTVKNALSLLLVSTTTTDLLATPTSCYTHMMSLAALPTNGCGGGGAGATTPRFASTTVVLPGSGVIATTTRVVTGNGTNFAGWIPVNFTQVSGGSPVSVLPVDPTNTGDFYYAFRNNSQNQYELDANLESNKYASSTSNKESSDGGDRPNIYEVGTNLAL